MVLFPYSILNHTRKLGVWGVLRLRVLRRDFRDVEVSRKNYGCTRKDCADFCEIMDSTNVRSIVRSPHYKAFSRLGSYAKYGILLE